MANGIIITVVVIYMLFMLWIGWYSSKRISSNTDFMVAGRRLGPFLMAGTLAATEIGGGSSLGVVQQGMQNHGISASWYIITMGLAFVILTFLAPKFRAATVKTVPEYFRRRYGKSSGVITAIIMLIPLIGLTEGQFVASGTILSAMLGIDFKLAIVIVAVIVTAYSVMGGLWSVTITDFVQVFMIVIGMALAIPFALRTAGGWDSVVANVPADTFNMFKGYSPMAVIALTIMYVATFTVGQEAVSRYYAARDGKAARQGSILAAIVNFVYAFVPAILGIITLALMNMGIFSAEEFDAVGARYALPVLAVHTMPALICGLLFAGIISATMSSSDSDLLGAGSIFANDIYRAVLKPNADNKEVMRVTKIAMVVVSLISMFAALFNTTSLIAILTFAFTLRAAGTFFPYVLGHYWKGASVAGTITSVISGSIVVIYFEKIIKEGMLFFGVKQFFQQPIIPALIVSVIFFFIFSALMPPKEPSLELTPEED